MYTLRRVTPTLPLVVIVTDDHVVRAAGFAEDADELAGRMGLDAPPDDGGDDGPVAQAVDRWLTGDLTALDDVVLEQRGTDFQQQVWAALRAVPAGRTASYAELAEAVGRPQATRAVGSACGRNLIAPFVPCHRAVRTDGTLGGYYYGLDVKGWLLDHEAGQD